jgi:hypothetical protein
MDHISLKAGLLGDGFQDHEDILTLSSIFMEGSFWTKGSWGPVFNNGCVRLTSFIFRTFYKHPDPS